METFRYNIVCVVPLKATHSCILSSLFCLNHMFLLFIVSACTSEYDFFLVFS